MPIGTVTAGTTVLNVYAGTPESGIADFFTYKNVLYTLVKSAGVYVAVQKSYTVYVSGPASKQQQLAVFDMNGTTYLVTDGTTAGDASPGGHQSGHHVGGDVANPRRRAQFGLVYGFAAQPTNVIAIGHGLFQFPVTDAERQYHAVRHHYTAGGNANVVTVDVPRLLPSFHAEGALRLHPVISADLRDRRLQRVHDGRRRRPPARARASRGA